MYRAIPRTKPTFNLKKRSSSLGYLEDDPHARQTNKFGHMCVVTKKPKEERKFTGMNMYGATEGQNGKNIPSGHIVREPQTKKEFSYLQLGKPLGHP